VRNCEVDEKEWFVPKALMAFSELFNRVNYCNLELGIFIFKDLPIAAILLCFSKCIY
jgi:hypothetical protein